jgi:hypothetical protein
MPTAEVYLLREVAARHKLDERTLRRALAGHLSSKTFVRERQELAVAEFRKRASNPDAPLPSPRRRGTAVAPPAAEPVELAAPEAPASGAPDYLAPEQDPAWILPPPIDLPLPAPPEDAATIPVEPPPELEPSPPPSEGESMSKIAMTETFAHPHQLTEMTRRVAAAFAFYAEEFPEQEAKLVWRDYRSATVSFQVGQKQYEGEIVVDGPLGNSVGTPGQLVLRMFVEQDEELFAKPFVAIVAKEVKRWIDMTE